MAFSRNPEILTLNRLSFMGLGARESSLICRRNPLGSPQLFRGRQLQSAYNEFLHETLRAGQAQDSANSWLSVYLAVYRAFSQRRFRASDTSEQPFGNQGLHVHLIPLGERVLRLRRDFFETGQIISLDDMAVVRLFDERVASAADHKLIEMGRLLDAEPGSMGPILHPSIFDAYSALPEWRPRRLPFVSALFLEENKPT